jgi:transposase
MVESNTGMDALVNDDAAQILISLSSTTNNQLPPRRSNEKQGVRVAIQALDKLGLTNSKIASMLKVNIKTVKLWNSRDTTKELKRYRRPTVLTANNKIKIETLCRDKWGVSTRKITKMLNVPNNSSMHTTSISRTSVIKYLHSTDWGRTAYRPIIKPMLSAKNIADRLDFCHRIRELHYLDADHFAEAKLNQLLFTDESIVELYPKPNSQNTRIRTSDPDHRGVVSIPKHGLKIMIAGGLCARGLSKLHILDHGATVNGEYYRNQILPIYFETLESGHHFEEPSNVVFMQDGAPAHTARATISLLSEKSLLCGAKAFGRAIGRAIRRI